MKIDEYLKELEQVPKRLAGTLLDKFLETEEMQSVMKIIDHAKQIGHESKRLVKDDSDF